VNVCVCACVCVHVRLSVHVCFESKRLRIREMIGSQWVSFTGYFDVYDHIYRSLFIFTYV